MAETRQGEIEQQYHHIDAPTVTNKEWEETHRGRRLSTPADLGSDCWRTDELRMLAYGTYPFWVKRKLDGTNMRIHWDGEQVIWNGKSNNATFPTDVIEYMNSTFMEEIFEEKFGRDKEVTLYGEGMGPKVQGNELGLDAFECVLFDVKIGDVFLEPESIIAVAKYFNIKTCYDYMGENRVYTSDLASIVEAVRTGWHRNWEGVVAEPVAGLRDRLGDRIVVKIKNKDYLEKENG